MASLTVDAATAAYVVYGTTTDGNIYNLVNDLHLWQVRTHDDVPISGVCGPIIAGDPFGLKVSSAYRSEAYD